MPFLDPPTDEEARRALERLPEIRVRARQIHQRHLGAIAAGLAVVGLAIVVPLVLVGRSPATRVQVVGPPVSPSVSATSTPTPEASAPPTVPPWPQRRLPGQGKPGVLTVLNGSLYNQATGVNDTNGLPVVAPVMRLDLNTGGQLASSTPLYPGQLVTAGNSLWLSSETGFSSTGGPGSFTVYRLDPGSLAILRTIALPTAKESAVTAPIAGAPSGELWVGNGSTLTRLDSAQNTVLTRLTVNGTLVGITLDGKGRLYDSIQQIQTTGMTVVEQRDSATGKLEASRQIPEAIAGAQVEASPSGVWVSYRGGMMGTTNLLVANTLADGPVPLASQPGGPDSSLFGGMMGTGATITGGVLWISGIMHLTCADPGTGAVRATEALPGVSFLGTLVAVGRQLFVGLGQDAGGGSFSGIQVVTPPAACWGS